MTQHFTDDNFSAEVLEMSKTKPVLVDFFAEWCGPCKMQAPIIDQLAEEVGDLASVGKLNTEEAQHISMHYSIMSIPTLMIFKNGQPVKIFNGVQSKDNLLAALKEQF